MKMPGKYFFVTAIIFSLTFFACRKDIIEPIHIAHKETIAATDSNVVTDIEGNTYKTVVIGGQVWMAENLRVTQYRNGDPITYVESATAWQTVTEGAYCRFQNQEPEISGNLYNYYTVLDARQMCPVDYHVPTDEDWDVLVKTLGGVGVASGKMKDTVDTWMEPNKYATNESGFSAVPGGYRGNALQNYSRDSIVAYFWSATNRSARYLTYASGYLNTNYTCNNLAGHSVRCIKDLEFEQK